MQRDSALRSALDAFREDSNFLRSISMTNTRENNIWNRPQGDAALFDFDGMYFQHEEHLDEINDEDNNESNDGDGISDDEEIQVMHEAGNDGPLPDALQANNNPDHLSDYRMVAARVMFNESFDLAAYVDQLETSTMFQPNDANDPFLPGSAHTKRIAATMMDDFCQAAHLNDRDRLDYLTTMKQLLPPDTNLPIRTTPHGNLVSEMDKYTLTDKFRCLTFDCCPCGRCVYAGQDAHLDRCKRCNMYRYTPCKHCQQEGFCPHPSARVATVVVNYTPFAGIVFDLLTQPGWMTALNYDNKDREDGKIQDLQDGEEFQAHMRSMHQNFQSMLENSDEKDIIEISLVLMVYFDGAQLFKKTTTTFMPLVVSILNLPPDIRSALGQGVFTLTVCTFKDGNNIAYIKNFKSNLHILKDPLIKTSF